MSFRIARNKRYLFKKSDEFAIVENRVTGKKYELILEGNILSFRVLSGDSEIKFVSKFPSFLGSLRGQSYSGFGIRSGEEFVCAQKTRKCFLLSARHQESGSSVKVYNSRHELEIGGVKIGLEMCPVRGVLDVSRECVERFPDFDYFLTVLSFAFLLWLDEI